jgi:hypothetical protein
MTPQKTGIIDGKEYFNVTIDFDKTQFKLHWGRLLGKKIELSKKIKHLKKKEVLKTDHTISYLE